MWNRYIAGEYGGMNEVMARLYRLTKDPRFLDGAKLFDNIDFFYGNVNRTAGLAANVDTIRGKHANQHIPQITGALGNVPRQEGAGLLPHCAKTSGTSPRIRTCTASAAWPAGEPNNAECFTAEPDTLWENGFATGRTERNLRHLQPAQAHAATVHVSAR